MTRITTSLAVALALGLGAAPIGASAQGMLGSGRTTARPAPDQRPREAPPALPGVQAQRGQQAIPAETPPSAMNPNDALFDGIARGDIATVRDAVARGADVGARNALGLTALDSAVDRGRSEIMFYLLSVRGTASYAAPPPQARPAGRANAAPQRRAPLPAEPAEARNTRTAPAAPSRQQTWQDGGGTPQPGSGFLGFDAGRGG
ncbi:ankyrin repeat domain-containing protein [Roseococcus sp. YIM B11640]|uniref:ankyrin repeat domain-containing protein n=1 Tax=Roseococcus sp. YIM B11640 TaxID=3133973 RepID=UPI003C7E2A62